MRVLVTGRALYIGSHLVDALPDDGHEVAVLDNVTTGRVANLAHRLREIRFLNGSILDDALLHGEVERADLVFHLAAVGVRHWPTIDLEAGLDLILDWWSERRSR